MLPLWLSKYVHIWNFMCLKRSWNKTGKVYNVQNINTQLQIHLKWKEHPRKVNSFLVPQFPFNNLTLTFNNFQPVNRDTEDVGDSWLYFHMFIVTIKSSNMPKKNCGLFWAQACLRWKSVLRSDEFTFRQFVLQGLKEKRTVQIVFSAKINRSICGGMGVC